LKPEPGREVDHYDWDNSKYVYKDEMVPEKPRIIPNTPLTAYPDMFVQELKTPTVIQERKTVWYMYEGNKRYQIRLLPNGSYRKDRIR
jgi:hypothetical protein